jgi:heat shock protein HtpX
MNTLKTTVLMALLTALFVGAGMLLGGRSGATTAFVLALVMNVGAYWFSSKIVLAMYRAKPVGEAEAPVLYRIVREQALAARIPMPKVCLIHQPAPNAFATGRNPENGVVAFTTGILDLLDESELSGVVAHELSHIKHRDILVGTIAATIAGAISYLANIFQWSLLLGGGRDERNSHPLALVGAVVAMVLAPLAAMLIQMAISRSREYLADEGGAGITRNPLSLAGALRKLQSGAQRVPMAANPATAHLFIVNPLTGGGLLSLFSTHPPIEDRIRRLEAMARGVR